MSTTSSSPTRRVVLAATAAAGVFGLAASASANAFGPSPPGSPADAEGNAIRTFRINVPEEALADLRRRIATTRWPDRVTVTGWGPDRTTRDVLSKHGDSPWIGSQSPRKSIVIAAISLPLRA